MAAPPEKTISNLSGKWVLERKLSTGMDDVMALQGLSWVKVKTLAIISVTETYRQYVDEKQVTHVDVTPTVTGGFKGQVSSYVVDGIARTREIAEFGEVVESSRWSDLTDVDDEYLREGWVYAEAEKKGPKNLVLQATMDKGACVLDGVWGFIDVDGKRYHARKTTCRKGGKTKSCCAVYSWKETV
ncbi:lccl domain-containing protein [Diplodia corticola]|uniref:Lccl domain-containing protein n=1 Tax=Diplodia corticola TaxID=236234 RepID=A0A1J9QV62_9PEZI|nr:lccl domain-containing protein [Diplodia corticola]OJD32281.1 lccl domain-containing protein [Diplodia corticola]